MSVTSNVMCYCSDDVDDASVIVYQLLTGVIQNDIFDVVCVLLVTSGGVLILTVLLCCGGVEGRRRVDPRGSARGLRSCQVLLVVGAG